MNSPPPPACGVNAMLKWCQESSPLPVCFVAGQWLLVGIDCQPSVQGGMNSVSMQLVAVCSIVTVGLFECAGRAQ